MEQRIAADQGHIAPAGAVDVARLPTQHQRFRGNPVRRSAGATQLVAGRQDREVAADRADISAVMDPDGTPGRDWSLPARTAGHEFVETEVTEFVAAVRGEDHVAERRRGEQSAQRFEPADKPAAAFSSRLPP